MKKLFAVLALAGLMVSCNSKKKDEKKETTTDTTKTTTGNTTTPTDNTSTPDNTTTVNADIPKFADPAVQKFANEYSAFLLDWKNHPNDVAWAQKWAAKSQEWAPIMTDYGLKLAKDPVEAQKWAQWSMWINSKMNPTNQ